MSFPAFTSPLAKHDVKAPGGAVPGGRLPLYFVLPFSLPWGYSCHLLRGFGDKKEHFGGRDKNQERVRCSVKYLLVLFAVRAENTAGIFTSAFLAGIELKWSQDDFEGGRRGKKGGKGEKGEMKKRVKKMNEGEGGGGEKTGEWGEIMMKRGEKMEKN